MDRIARMRQEIERRTKELDNDKYINIDARECRKSELGYMLRFLDTLSEEPDKSLEVDLKKEIDSEWKKCNPIDEGMGVESAHIHIEAFDIIARHFAEWQYQKDREEFAKIKANTWCEGYNEGLIKGAASQRVKLFEEGLNAVHQNNPSIIEKTIAGVFVKYGMDRMKEEMLKDAVEGEICGRVYDHINVRFADGVCKLIEPKNISHIPADVSKYNIGERVRIVVLKEEE